MQPVTHVPDAHATALADLLVLESFEILEPEEELVALVEAPHEHVQDPGCLHLPEHIVGGLPSHVLPARTHAAISARIGRIPVPDALLGGRIGKRLTFVVANVVVGPVPYTAKEPGARLTDFVPVLMEA